MAVITKIETIKAPFAHKQENIIQFMQQFYQFDPIEFRKISWLYRKSGIAQRFSVLPDFSKDKTQELFRLNGDKGEVSMSDRQNVYDEKALELSLELLKQIDTYDLDKVTHLITVSCTGITAPGLELKLLRELRLKASHRAINFMGCYAAIHAMKQAYEICASYSDANVLVVDIELCTLHFQYSKQPDLVNSAMLFGDGAAAWMVNGTAIENGVNLEIVNSFNQILHNDSDKMAWFPSETGFLMQLSSYIPDIIGDNVNELISAALSHYKLTDTSNIIWCVHPGGLKILDRIVQSMNLTKDDLLSSYEVLEEYGNMSSPTVIYVLDRLVRKNRIPKGKSVLLLAFGPGLSLETSLLKAV